MYVNLDVTVYVSVAMSCVKDSAVDGDVISAFSMDQFTVGFGLPPDDVQVTNNDFVSSVLTVSGLIEGLNGLTEIKC